MRRSESGRQVLEEMPRVSSDTWPQEKLLELPKDTFGFQYASWMSKHGFVSDERPVSTYVQDVELAYIIQRYRETHDTMHTLLGYDVTVGDEIAVKWYEMAEIGLPSTALASFMGPLHLVGSGLKNGDLGELKTLMAQQLPHIMHCVDLKRDNSEFFMSIFWEKEFETPCDELRERMGIVSFEQFQQLQR
uniref:Coenzyme Q biosynthesis protein 4 homolog n=1 Tax=Strombidium inclinatum TaxID=197538 RepID=A0A7S3IKJ4_9SPIT|mmetsp:Transcript_24795/g.38588  ORF Transcript_24795/g.38588 Transcript_24795/m.38588 type:complete len:190 (+) Transcript_24795:216-785(+)